MLSRSSLVRCEFTGQRLQFVRYLLAAPLCSPTACIPPAFRHSMPPPASHRQDEPAPTSLTFRLPRALAYIFPLVLVILYVSAVTSSPSKHTELVVQQDNSGAPASFSLLSDGEVQQWDGRRDWELGSVTLQRKKTAAAVEPLDSSEDCPSRFRQFAVIVEAGIARIGDLVALLLGLEDDDDVAGQQDGSGLAAWAESSIYVEVGPRPARCSMYRADFLLFDSSLTPSTPLALPRSALTFSLSPSNRRSTPSLRSLPPLPTAANRPKTLLKQFIPSRRAKVGLLSYSEVTAPSRRRSATPRREERLPSSSAIRVRRRAGSVELVVCSHLGVLVRSSRLLVFTPKLTTSRCSQTTPRTFAFLRPLSRALPTSRSYKVGPTSSLQRPMTTRSAFLSSCPRTSSSPGEYLLPRHFSHTPEISHSHLSRQ